MLWLLFCSPKDWYHLYLKQTLSFLRHLQTPGILYRLLFTGTHQQGVSTYCQPYGLLCAIATTLLVFISEQTFRAWYYRSIPHNLGRDFLRGTFALNITRVISPDLIPRCMAYRTCIQFLILFATVEDAVIRTCMYLLDFLSQRADYLFCFVRSGGQFVILRKHLLLDFQ